jgi:hypothetical protein
MSAVTGISHHDSIKMATGGSVAYPPVKFEYKNWMNDRNMVVVLNPKSTTALDGSIIGKLKQ